MSDFYSATAVGQEAIDAAGLDFILGDIENGSHPAQVILRKYTTCLEQLLRTAPWNFARKQAPLLLLADATGLSPNVGTIVPGNQFIYCYALPTDLAFLRYIPWWPLINPGTPPNNIQPPNPASPVVDNLGQPPFIGQRVVPARFLVTSDTNYIPPGTGSAPNDTPGISPIGRTVVCTNVQFAQAIYTYNAVYPNLWDSQFRAAMVAFLAAEIALPLGKDKKFASALRAQNIAIAKEKIANARVSDGREGWHSAGLEVDWMRIRNSGSYGYGGNGWWGNVGDWNCAWSDIGWGNTGNSSAY